MNALDTRMAWGMRFKSAWPCYGLAVLLFVALAIGTPGFLSPTNLLNILNQQVTLVMVTLGQALVVMAGGLDLSSGAVVSMTTAILSHDLPAPLAVLLALGAAMLVGSANGLGIVYLRVHPILMTLGSLTVVNGVALLLRPVPGGTAPAFLIGFARSEIFGIPGPILAMVLAVAACWLLLNRTRLGLHILAVGNNPESARLGGIRAERIVLAGYVLSSFLACLGGMNLSGRIASGDPLVGASFSLDAIAATALGGTLLSGGVGSIGGPMAGVAVLALVSNGLNFWNISAYYQMLVKGALLVIAVSLHRRETPGL